MKYLLSFILLLTLNTPAFAYDISDYFFLNKGAYCFFDRGAFYADGSTYSFNAGPASRYSMMTPSTATTYVFYMNDTEAGIVLAGLEGDSGNFFDMSTDNVVILASNLAEGQQVISTSTHPTFPLTVTSTYLGTEDVIIGSTTYPNCLKMRLHLGLFPSGWIEEMIWLAKDKGIVKVYRVPGSSDGFGIFSLIGLDLRNQTVIVDTLNGITQGNGLPTPGTNTVVVVPML